MNSKFMLFLPYDRLLSPPSLQVSGRSSREHSTVVLHLGESEDSLKWKGFLGG